MYYIDGYNLLFRLTHSHQTLRTRKSTELKVDNTLLNQRQALIRLLQTYQVKGLLIFDGKHRLDEESGRSYPSPLEVIYTPKGQTADQYILETLLFVSNPASITVVSDDRHLIQSARSLGAKTQSPAPFLHRLQKKRPKKPDPVESKFQIDRLLKIFESRLQRSDED